ncbi:MAG: tyrosine-type recombinase/integrase [Deferribacteraceae bacterium]|jgi:integrase|nr:tyrosine-type recombinase/integrase [Deferribacteraceae bacterium]
MTTYRQTLSEFINTVYLPYYMGRGLKGFATEKGRMDIMMEYPIVAKKLTDINKNDVTLFIAGILSARKITKATSNRYYARIHAIFNFAINEGYMDKNPCQGIRKFKEFCRKRALSEEEIRQLLDACAVSKSYYLFDTVCIALNTGMRRKEILTLSSKQIDFKNRIITLYGVKTKSGYDREIPLNDEVIPVLIKLIKRINNTSLDKLFNVKSVKTAFNTAVKKAGIDPVRFHDLRRTFATHLRDAGVDITVICEILGHSSVKVTERYLYNSRNTLQNSIKKIGFKLKR